MDIFLGVLFLIVCVLLIGVVLLQKGRGGGLSAAFGGAGSSAFGTRVGDVFTWVTIVLTALFLLLAIGTFLVFKPPVGTVGNPFYDPSPADVVDKEKVCYVDIRCATGDAEIRYTLDGSTPDEESELFDNVLVAVKPGQTLKARAYRAGGWTPSEVVEAYYGPVEEETPLTSTAPASMPAEIEEPLEDATEPAEAPVE